jgi:hypothetical protein
MKPNELAKLLCKKEGKKIGVNIAQMREIVGCLADIIFESSIDKQLGHSTLLGIVDSINIHAMLGQLGAKRAKKKKKK